jgi:hypothetical protein
MRDGKIGASGAVSIFENYGLENEKQLLTVNV